MFRGIELILQGPRSARSLDLGPAHLRRLHHGPRAGHRPRGRGRAGDRGPGERAHRPQPDRAAAQNVQDHVIHFYHLHALDWVDVTLALKADPAKTSQLAQSISDWPKSSRPISRPSRIASKALVESGQLSLFSQRLLGPSRLPPSARSQPAGGGALHRGARVAEGLHPHPRRTRREEPAPADLPGGRDGHRDGSQRARRDHQSGTNHLPHGTGKQGAGSSSTRFTYPTCSRSPVSIKDWFG